MAPQIRGFEEANFLNISLLINTDKYNIYNMIKKQKCVYSFLPMPQNNKPRPYVFREFWGEKFITFMIYISKEYIKRKTR